MVKLSSEYELYHHGIKGQKWGIRRFQNSDGTYTAEGKERYGIGSKNPTDKQIKRFRSDLEETYRYEHPLYKKMVEYENKANALYEKHEFDGDDGGGGRTEADRRAGKKYMEYWEKYNELDSQISEDITKKVDEEVIAKYGKAKVNSLMIKESAKAGAAIVGILGANALILTHPLKSMAVGAGALTVGCIYASMKAKKAKNSPLSDSEKARLNELERKEAKAMRYKSDRDDWYSSKEYKEKKELSFRKTASKYL